MMTRTRDGVFAYISLSCEEGEHERCSIGPEKPYIPEELAPRCACPHHELVMNNTNGHPVLTSEPVY